MHKIHTANLTMAEKRDLWIEILKDYEQSHLTPREFCQQRHIKLDLFYYHTSVHRKRLQNKKASVNEVTFIPIITEQTDNISGFRLTTPHGIELHFSNAFDATRIVQILNVLRGVSC